MDYIDLRAPHTNEALTEDLCMIMLRVDKVKSETKAAWIEI